MDSPGMPIQLDPVALPEAPKSRDVAPGKKARRPGRNERRSRRGSCAYRVLCRDPPVQEARSQDRHRGANDERACLKTKHTGLKQGEEALLLVNGQLAAVKKPVKQPLLEVQAKETLENAKELAGAAMKAGTEKGAQRG